jgi:hypothetical protein
MRIVVFRNIFKKQLGELWYILHSCTVVYDKLIEHFWSDKSQLDKQNAEFHSDYDHFYIPSYLHSLGILFFDNVP